jgi:hypothetical protein
MIAHRAGRLGIWQDPGALPANRKCASCLTGKVAHHAMTRDVDVCGSQGWIIG